MAEVFVMSWQEREMFSQEWKFVREADWWWLQVSPENNYNCHTTFLRERDRI